MKLSEARVDRLAAQIVDTLADRDDVRLNAGDATLLHAVTRIMVDELMVEERLDAEIHKLLQAYKYEITMGRMSYDELFKKTKQRLVRDRKLVL